MAVVTRYTAGYPQQSWGAGYLPNAHEARGSLKVAAFNIAVTSGDSIASVYKLGKVPSNAIILPISSLEVPAIAGLTSVSVGFDDLNGTTASAALMSAVDLHSGGAFSMVSAVSVANRTQRVWQLLGFTSDPGKSIDVYASLGAAPSASGAMAGMIYYSAAGI